MEQPPKDTIRPLLCGPPLTLLALVLVLRHSLFWDLQIYNPKEKLTPWDETLGRLLVWREVDDNAGFVGFEYEVQHRGDLLRGTRGCLQHLRRDPYQSREELRDDTRHNVCFLAESAARNQDFLHNIS